MCLSAVKEIYDNPSPMIVDGWKGFDGTPSKPKVQIPINGTYEVPLDKWIKATDENAKNGIRADDKTTYAPGFHAYADESEVKPWSNQSLRRVYLRQITCLGRQDGKTTVVAQEMFVPSDTKNGWPPRPQSILEKAKNVVAGNA